MASRHQFTIWIPHAEWSDEVDEPVIPLDMENSGPCDIVQMSALSDAVVGFVIGFASGVPASVLAAYIYEYFARHKTKRITIRHKQTVKKVAVERGEIESFVEETVIQVDE